MPSQTSPIPLNMPHYGFFTSPTGVIFLGVTVTSALFDLHRGFYQQCNTVIDWEGGNLYIPDLWVPHCTLAYDLQTEKIGAAIDVCRAFPLPFETVGNRICLVDSDTGDILSEFQLTG